MPRDLPGPPPEDLAARDCEFSGRTWALDRIGHFIVADRGATLLVVAKPGVGKTAVAVRLVRLARGEVPVPPGLAIPAIHAAHFCRASEFASIDPVSVCENLAIQLTASVPGFAETLPAVAVPGGATVRIEQRIRRAETGSTITAIGSLTIAERDPRAAFDLLIRRPLQALAAARHAPGRVVLLIDGLDESVEGATSSGRTLVDLLAVELAKPVPGACWVLSTRAENVASRLEKSAAEIFDLAADTPPHVDDILGYAQGRLMPSLGQASGDLAGRIASAANGNFLYAHHVVSEVLAGNLSQADTATMTLPDGLAGVYGDFLDRKIGIGDDWRNLYRPVLGALVQARGSGLTKDELAAVTGLSPSHVDDTVAACSPYLSGDGSAGLTVYHQSLREYLRAEGRHFIYPLEASAQILDRLAPGRPGQRRWDRARPHLLEQGIYYAIDVGRVDELITDPGYLIHVDPQILLSALDGLDLPDSIAMVIYRTSAHLFRTLPPERRRQVLALDAARWGDRDLAAAIEAVPVAGHEQSAARVQWATGSRINTAQSAVLAAGTSPVDTVAAGELGGRPVAVTSAGYSVHLWDLATRTHLRWLGSHDDLAFGVAIGHVDGRAIAVSGSYDHTVRVWDLASGTQVGELAGHRGPVHPVAITQLDGRPVVVSGDSEGQVLIWDLGRRALLGQPLSGHEGTVFALAVGNLDGRPIAVSGGNDGTVRIWDLAGHAQSGEPLVGHPGNVLAVALTELGGSLVAVTGGNDGALRIWDLASRTQVGDPLTGESDGIRTLAIGRVNNQTVAVTSGFDGVGRIWDLAGRTQIGDPLSSHHIRSVTFTTLHGDAIAVTGGDDGTVRLWDLTRHARIGKALRGHSGHVQAVALGTLGGRRVAVSGGYDHMLRIWDLASGSPEFALTTEALINAVALGEIGGRPSAVIGDSLGGLQIWDLVSRVQLGESMSDPGGPHSAAAAVALGWVNGRQIAVSGGLDGRLRVWDLGRSALLGTMTVAGDSVGFTGLALAELADGPVAVTGCVDGTVRVWDLSSRTQVGEPMAGHRRTGWVRAVAAGTLLGRRVAVTGSNDLRVWDLVAHRQIGEPLLSDDASVQAVALDQPDGRLMAAVACTDQTVTICDLQTRQTVARLSLSEQPTAVAYMYGTLLIALGHEIAVYQVSV